MDIVRILQEYCNGYCKNIAMDIAMDVDARIENCEFKSGEGKKCKAL